uniref:MTS domain-containing protein n=1 Tax=Heterorhabditis bacteriophora TaxID=37862 RepID=A0A1I7WXG1_HETBA
MRCGFRYDKLVIIKIKIIDMNNPLQSSVFEEHGSDPVSDENIDEMQSTGLKHKYDIVAVYMLIYSICVLNRIHFELRDHYPQVILEIGCGSGIVSAFLNLVYIYP